MKTNSIALTALGEYTECDIRSCLNTLQFLSKKKETLNVFDISSQVVGQKDISRNVLDIWKEVFQRKKAKRERRSHNSCSSTSMEFDFLHSLISYRGDYDLILDGIHENILQLQYHDPLMQKTVKCFDSFVASDLIHQYVMRTQQMPLKVYMPSMAIIVHSLVAQVQKPNIEWPRSYQRYRMMLAEKMEILKSWHYKIPAHIARHLSASSFVEDLISPLLHILSPPTLRPVALQLLSEKEKNDLTQLVSIMISYCITYKNVKSDLLPINLRREADTDRSALSFDPSISDFINFKDYMPGHYVLSLALKQVEKQKILQVKVDRSLIVPNQCTANQLDFVAVETDNASSAKIDHAAAVAETQIENAKNILKLQQCNANNLSISSNLGPQGGATGDVKSSGNMKKLSTCFFDRFRKSGSKGGQSNDKSIQKVATMERDSRPLIFKFNEGFTNAVKRPVRIREFLL
ncbi:chromosome transmission fidelity protein 18-like [Quillaja saponaria]|uniref:Chromosome transmission fidelity protein 18-like n=1 Tax=Quillaja saponaria TaxID=32244 RepID=A0AAD7QDX4_QUISA|nr:chromosome transmission fidelity protein 18-like [Quillaja saponaria]